MSAPRRWAIPIMEIVVPCHPCGTDESEFAEISGAASRLRFFLMEGISRAEGIDRLRGIEQCFEKASRICGACKIYADDQIERIEFHPPPAWGLAMLKGAPEDREAEPYEIPPSAEEEQDYFTFDGAGLVINRTGAAWFQGSVTLASNSFRGYECEFRTRPFRVEHIRAMLGEGRWPIRLAGAADE